VRGLVEREVIYEDRAALAIREAERADKWHNVEEVVRALEWGLVRDPALGWLLNERGLRFFVFPGAVSTREPDVDVIYEDSPPWIIIHDLVFRDAKARQAGHA
jgi:hypothetical protein